MRRRILVSAAMLACAVALAVPTAVVAAPSGSGSHARAISAVNALEGTVLTEINSVRAKYRLGPLRLSSQLSAAADRQSRQMGQVGFFSHSSADGSSFSKRIGRFYPSAGFQYWSIGENLLWASPDTDAPTAVRMWMRSPGHRENLLASRWREIGLSAVHVTSAPGTYGGLDVTILAADFGVRRSAESPAAFSAESPAALQP